MRLPHALHDKMVPAMVAAAIATAPMPHTSTVLAADISGSETVALQGSALQFSSAFSSSKIMAATPIDSVPNTQVRHLGMTVLLADETQIDATVGLDEVADAKTDKQAAVEDKKAAEKAEKEAKEAATKAEEEAKKKEKEEEKARKKAAKQAAKQAIEDLKRKEAEKYKEAALAAGLPEPTGMFGSEGIPKAISKLLQGK